MKGYWEHIQGARDVQTFACADYRMLIIPSLQDEMHHVIIERAEEGITLRCLLTKEAIEEAYDIKI